MDKHMDQLLGAKMPWVIVPYSAHKYQCRYITTTFGTNVYIISLPTS